jgi:integrase
MNTKSILPKDARDRLGRLLDMPYTVDELSLELRTEDAIISIFARENALFEPGGWINGRGFRIVANDYRLHKQRLTPVARDNWLDVQAYLEHLRRFQQLDERSIEAYRVCLKRLLQWAGETPLPLASEIEPTLPAYLLTGGLEVKALRPGTTSRTCQVSRGFFEHMRAVDPERYRQVDDRWVNTLVMGRKHGAQTVLKQHRYFDLADVRKLAALKPETLRERRDIAATCFLFLSGMRVGAFTSLPASCVDLERLTVAQLPSEGVRTKNSKAAITSLLDIPDLLRVVREWDAFVRERGGDTALWYTPLYEAKYHGISTNPSASGLNRDEDYRKGLRAICKRAGVPYLSPHKLRHGHAVYGVKHARNMQELKAVSQNLMHSSISITDGIYGNLTADDVNRTITSLGKAPAPAAATDGQALLLALAKLQQDPGLLQRILEAS